MSQIDNLLSWVHKNAFLRQELQVKPSKFGGLGVFVPNLSVLDEDPLLMRIPKSNVLSVKNSGIYNLLVDYVFDSVDISQGIFGLVLATIYELSFGSSSPWHSYLATFNVQLSFTPIFQWNEQDKLNLKNTDFEKLGLLNDEEFSQFVQECRRFAQANQSIVAIPPVLQDLDLMGKIFTSITSRAFAIDNFYQLSLVPFADLFNHMSPVVVDGKLSNQENVNFVCDGQVCDDCGEQDCDHEDEEYSSDEVDGVDAIEENGVETSNGKIDGPDSEISDDADVEDDEGDEDVSDVSEAENVDNDDSEDSEDVSDGDDATPVEPVEEISEITMEYIAKMEQEMNASDSDDDCGSDSDTNTLILSDEESTIEESDIVPQTEIEAIDDDLAQELADGSKCCDIVMERLPLEEYNYEIFNSYGKELSNLDLLQKYGFIVDNNPNDNISLVNYFTQSFISSKLTKEKAKQLLLRIDWFEEEGFEMINEIMQQQHDHSHEATEGAHDCCLDTELPQSWQDGVKINFDGTLSVYANSLENLIRLNHKMFKHKILLVKPKRRIANIKQLLTIPCQETYINNMCKTRIANYAPIQPSDNSNFIAKIVQQEKDILSRFIQRNKNL